MWGILFALTATLAAGLEFPNSKTLTYKYEGLVLSGLPEKGLGRAGARIKCQVEISGAGPKHFLLKARNLQVDEFNGIWPGDPFTSSAKLTKALEKQLSRPIKFEYSRGDIGNIYIPNDVSDTVANIYKGILNILQLTIKKTQNVYTLQEKGIEGICHTTYMIEENKKTNHLIITKSKDLNNCEERARMLIGNAFSHTCSNCKKRNKNFRAAATYNYKIKKSQTGAVLLEADVLEVHEFTPFNELGGSAVLEARQKLVLVSAQEQSHSSPENEYKTRSSLRYHFAGELIQTPVQLLKMKDVEVQAIEILHHLVKHRIGPSSKESPTKFLQLVQVLREAHYENIEAIWKQFSRQPHYRRWILDAIPAIANPLSLRFLKHKIEIKDLTEFEAVQAVLMTLQLIKADHEAIAEAKSLLAIIKPKRDSLLRKVAFLSYGSLASKNCIDHCAKDILQPINDLLAEAASEAHERDIILALKALGNTGQPASIKSIQKFLPGFSSSAFQLPVRIQSTALRALKSIALNDPRKVQEICLQLFANFNLNPIMRMIAVAMLLDSRPPAGLVMTVANMLLRETDTQVASFSYSLLRSFSKSSAPDLQEVAAACHMAITSLKSKLERFDISYSTGVYYDTFEDSLMSGFSALFNSLKNPANGLPLAIFTRLQVYFMGIFSNLIEVGFQSEGIQELLMNKHIFSSESEPPKLKKIMDMLKKLSNWKPLPLDEPLASAYIKIFGQEILYHQLDKHDLQNIVKFFYKPDEIFPALQGIVNQLENGMDIDWSKPLLSSEARQVVPTCVGLPLETSLYYSSVTRAEIHAQAQFQPPPTQEISISKLLNSNINLNSKISVSMAKHITFVMGINTQLLQAGMEVQGNIHVLLPVNVAATIDINQNNFKLDIIPNNQESEVISLRSKAYTVTRNVEDLDAAKMIPLVPAGTEPNVLKQTFNPRDLSAGELLRTEGKYSDEFLQKDSSYSEEQPSPNPSTFSTCSPATNLGFQLCLEQKSTSAAFIRNTPFYHMIGAHSVKVMLKPVHMDASVEKIQIEFQAGPQAATKMVRSVNLQKAGTDEQEMENTVGAMALSKLKKILCGKNKTLSQDHSINNTCSSSSSESADESPSDDSFKIGKREKKKHNELKNKHQKHHHNKKKHQDCQNEEENVKKHQHKHKPKKQKHQSHDTKSRKHEHHVGNCSHEHGQDHEHGLDHEGGHEHGRDREGGREHGHDREAGREHGRDREGGHEQGSDREGGHKHGRDREGGHEHGRNCEGGHELGRDLEGGREHGLGEEGGHEHVRGHEGGHDNGHGHEHGRGHEGGHEHGCGHEGGHEHVRGHEGGHDHGRGHAGGHEHGRGHEGGHEHQLGPEGGHEHQRGHEGGHEHGRGHEGGHEHGHGHGHQDHEHKQKHGQDHSKIPDSQHDSCRFLSSSSSSSDSSNISQRRQKVTKDESHRRHKESSSKYTRNTESSSSESSSVSQSSSNNIDERSTQSRDVGEKSKKAEPSKKTKTSHQDRTSRPSNYGEQYGTALYEALFKSTSADMQEIEEGQFSKFKDRRSSSSRDRREQITHKHKFIGGAPDFIVLVTAFLNDNTHHGYQTTAYVDSTQHHAQIIMVSLAENNPWKACFDAAVSGRHKSFAVARWGQQCKDYRISAKLSSGQLAGSSAVQMAWNWGKLPNWMKNSAQRIMKFVPGVAYMLGFSEMYHKNPRHQLTVTVAATTTQQIDAIFKTQELTLYKQAIPVPFYFAHGPHSVSGIKDGSWSILPEITTMIKSTGRAECEVNGERITTFDKTNLDCSLSSANCYTVLAQDCTNQLRFIIAMKQKGQGNPSFQIDAKLGSYEIEVYSDSSEEFHVMLNGRMLLLQNNTYVNEKDCIRIHKNATTVTIKAPKHGVEQIAFNGESTKITIAQWLKGKTCGICGNSDGQRQNDLLKPNQQKARSCNSLVHSWMLPDNSCSGSMLARKFVMLENHLIEEQELTCYSLEPVLQCVKGCNPIATNPVRVAFHCLPKGTCLQEPNLPVPLRDQTDCAYVPMYSACAYEQYAQLVPMSQSAQAVPMSQCAQSVSIRAKVPSNNLCPPSPPLHSHHPIGSSSPLSTDKATFRPGSYNGLRTAAAKSDV
ncbi:vitellogenin-1-like [Discoglossus pictus]